MCNLLPEVPNCCGVFSYRVGMLFICTMSIIVGCIILNAVELNNPKSVEDLEKIAKIGSPQEAVTKLGSIIPSIVQFMGFLFIVAGFLLLYANLVDDTGLIECFVHLSTLAVVLGFLLVIATAYNCMFQKCLLAKLDTLTTGALMLCVTLFLLVWLYFLSVAMSYVNS